MSEQLGATESEVTEGMGGDLELAFAELFGHEANEDWLAGEVCQKSCVS